MVAITFNKYIIDTESVIVVYSIETGCVHLLPSLASNLAHFGLLSDSGRHGRPASSLGGVPHI